jgi:hypothetical protein
MTRLSRWLALASFLVAAPIAISAPSLAHGVGPSPDGAALEPDAPLPVSAACTLEPGPINTFSYIWSPPEELQTYAWRIPASGCAACPAPGALSPTKVTIRMRWLFACSAQVQVSIVGALPGPGCLLPDTNQVLCGPATYTISGPGNVAAIHALPLPTGCCVSGDAFVFLRFSGLGACATATLGPGLAASTVPPVACDQFVTAASIFPGFTDWATVGAPTSTWLSLEADCCQSTPARERSWGELKSIYR